jgi:hypothetical protein
MASCEEHIRCISCRYPFTYPGFGFRLWGIGETSPINTPGCSPRLELSFSLHYGNHTNWSVAVLDFLGKILPSEEIQSLHLEHSSINDWSFHNGQFKFLQWPHNDETSLEFSNSFISAPAEPQEALLTLPVLCELGIEHYDFIHGEYGEL